ncbi:MAG TPA: hypothetical protein VFF06_21195, partial [Polyangia bacterium]|nr:hypothetical protein [Polyangia bacterium]
MKIRLVGTCALLLAAAGCGGDNPASGGDGGGGLDGGARGDLAGGGQDSGGTPMTGGIFEVPEPWTKDVSGLTKDGRSDAIIGALTSQGGWGNGGTMQIDFSIPLFFADAQTPRQTITADPGGYCYGGTDCDPVPLQMPLPANGNTEGSTNYTCDTSGNTNGQGDCHVLVVETSEKKLYELYNATAAGSAFTALGAFVWDL